MFTLQLNVRKLRMPCTACWRCGAAAIIGKKCIRCSAQN